MQEFEAPLGYDTLLMSMFMKMFLEENDLIAIQGNFSFSGITIFCHQDLTLSCVKIQT